MVIEVLINMVLVVRGIVVLVIVIVSAIITV